LTLSKGWILFKFLKSEDAEWVLKKPWSIDSTPFLLKKWTPLFNASREKINVMSVWVQLLRTTTRIMDRAELQRIGERVGDFYGWTCPSGKQGR
jgi:hypothetical protein